MENTEFLKPKPNCPILDVNGFISNGKQFDIDITLPKDKRNVIYGTIKDEYKEPVKNAVVKLIEIIFGKDGMKKRIPITHTFTDEYGEFVFGPLCPDKEYTIDIWVNDVSHYKFNAISKHDGKCLNNKHVENCKPPKDEHKPIC